MKNVAGKVPRFSEAAYCAASRKDGAIRPSAYCALQRHDAVDTDFRAGDVEALVG